MDSGDQITVEMRLAAIEEKLDRLLAHLGLDGDGWPGPEAHGRTAAQKNLEDQITALIRAGKKIQAIKAWREATGHGLKDAKNAVEAVERSMRADGGRW